MKINLEAIIRNYDGSAKPLKKEYIVMDESGNIKKTADGNFIYAIIADNLEKLTLRNICQECLFSDHPDEKDKTQKSAKFALAMKINNADDEIELELKEISRIQKLVEIRYEPLIVGQVDALLEGKEIEFKTK